jgi:hypothetical protein
MAKARQKSQGAAPNTNRICCSKKAIIEYTCCLFLQCLCGDALKQGNSSAKKDTCTCKVIQFSKNIKPNVASS